MCIYIYIYIHILIYIYIYVCALFCAPRLCVSGFLGCAGTLRDVKLGSDPLHIYIYIYIYTYVIL